METMTVEEYRQLLKKRNKYNASPTGGNDSKKEHARLGELQLLERSGAISHLEEKRSFILQEGFTDQWGRRHIRIQYTPDYYYYDHEEMCWIAEDAKGGKATQTTDFRMRFKMAQSRYPEVKFITS